MLHFRLYGLDTEDRFVSGDDFMCDGEAEAVAEARRRLGDYAGVEIWQSDRRVGCVRRIDGGCATL